MANPDIVGKVCLIGDIHGDTSYLYQTELADKDTNIILLGDVGVGFVGMSYPWDETLSDLASTGKKIYCIRGNHDDPSFWTDKQKFEQQKQKLDLSNVVMLEDGIVNINEVPCLVVGGGISVDRQFRTVNKSYWEEEYVHKVTVPKTTEVKVILSHTCIRPPFKCIADLEGFIYGDPNLEKDLKEEESRMIGIQNMFKPSHWFFGHFHLTQSFEYNGTRMRAVNIGEVIMPEILQIH